MNYQVWTKNEYDAGYTKIDCDDVAAVKREVESSVRASQDPLVTIEVPYTMDITIGEIKDEATKSKAEYDPRPRAEGHGKVHRGAKGDPSPVGEGSGDPVAGDSPGD